MTMFSLERFGGGDRGSGQKKRYRGAFPIDRIYFQIPIMFFHDRERRGEPHALSSWFRGVIDVKDFIHICLQDANPGVLDGDFHIAIRKQEKV